MFVTGKILDTPSKKNYEKGRKDTSLHTLFTFCELAVAVIDKKEFISFMRIIRSFSKLTALV